MQRLTTLTAGRSEVVWKRQTKLRVKRDGVGDWATGLGRKMKGGVNQEAPGVNPLTVPVEEF